MKKLQIKQADTFENINIPIPVQYSPEGFKERFYIPNSTYSKARIKFIVYCVNHKLSYADIGNILGISKQYANVLYRYQGKYVSEKIKTKVRERDKNRCKICRNSGILKTLHIHHIGNPANNRINNLVLLCAKCHKKVESLKKAGCGKLSIDERQ